MRPRPLMARGAALCLMILAGCGQPHRRNAVPQELAANAQIPGMPAVRAWGDAFSPDFQRDLIDSIRQEESATPEVFQGADPTINLLALSGGGSDGAYGAGLLCGWTQAGDRPRFKLVTGISTGSLIAPFAFLGPEYDARLKEVYTTLTTKDLVTAKPMLAVVGSDAMMDTTPLARMLEKYIDDSAIRAIAAEHAKGRRLFVGTTNLDTQRPVVWNMGAIASVDRPEARRLFRQVLLASASIPVAFSPQYVSVEAGGKTFDEMHVDGGTSTEVFLYGPVISPLAAGRELGLAKARRRPRVFIIRNTQINPEWQVVEGRLLPIAGRAVATLIKSQGIGDLYRIYGETQRDGVDYNLAFVPGDIKLERREAFDKEDMNKLFDAGFEAARKGYPWEKVPPALKLASAP